MIDLEAQRAAQTIAAAGPEAIQLGVLDVLGGLGNVTAAATGATDATTDDAANATNVLATPAWAMCLSNGDL